jgi:hypothetical protein
MGVNMGLHPLLLKGSGGRTFRWMFSIQPYIGDQISMLPPFKSARPNISFKEYQAEHLHETIYFPGKVEWQTVELSLYDIKCKENPIYEWMKLVYNPDPDEEFYGPSLSQQPDGTQFKTTAQVSLYNGCGDTIESWIYMNAYPVKIDWGELDMNNAEVVTAQLSLRFDRAYILQAKPIQQLNSAGTTFGRGNPEPRKPIASFF